MVFTMHQLKTENQKERAGISRMGNNVQRTPRTPAKTLSHTHDASRCRCLGRYISNHAEMSRHIDLIKTGIDQLFVHVYLFFLREARPDQEPTGRSDVGLDKFKTNPESPRRPTRITLGPASRARLARVLQL